MSHTKPKDFRSIPYRRSRNIKAERFALPVIRTRERALTIGPLRLPSVRPR